MQNETPTYYTVLTADIRYRKDLTDFQKLLIAEVEAITKRQGYFFDNNTMLAQRFNKTKQTVSKNIIKLRDKGIFELQYHNNNVRLITINKGALNG